MSSITCPVCGGEEFASRSILWPDLIHEWQLAPHETDYINRQQGFHCTRCGSNLRTMTLARAIIKSQRFDGFLSEWVVASAAALLEINEAGSLTKFLNRLRRYTFVSYPKVDMHHLPFADGSFDVTVHSDTLEHVPDPIHALGECRRVLRPGGFLAYTVPAVVGRMSRSREGLAPSYHGNSKDQADDMLVHTEFGADFWTYPTQAGFGSVSLISLEFPASVALLCER